MQRRTSYSLPRPPPGYESSIQQQQRGDDAESDSVPTPRLVENDFVEASASPLSVNFAPETPSNVPGTFPIRFHGEQLMEEGEEEEGRGGDVTITGKRSKRGGVLVMEPPHREEGEEEEGGVDDLHAQFCSVLLLDLGNGTAIPLSPSPGTEPRPDPFTLLAC